MKMEKSSEFDKVRSAVKSMEDVMNTVNNALGNPLRIFDASKSWDSEKIIDGEIQACKDLIAELADSKQPMDHNLHATTNFLEQTKAFTSAIASDLDELEVHLSQFGFKKPQDSIAEEDVLAISAISADISPLKRNRTHAGDLDTSGIQEFAESPDNSSFSNVSVKPNRELIFEH